MIKGLLVILIVEISFSKLTVCGYKNKQILFVDIDKNLTQSKLLNSNMNKLFVLLAQCKFIHSTVFLFKLSTDFIINLLVIIFLILFTIILLVLLIILLFTIIDFLFLVINIFIFLLAIILQFIFVHLMIFLFLLLHLLLIVLILVHFL